jgi:hypothetical protein
MCVLFIIAGVFGFTFINCGGLWRVLRDLIDMEAAEEGAAASDRYTSCGTARSSEEHERRLTSQKHRGDGCVIGVRRDHKRYQ